MTYSILTVNAGSSSLKCALYQVSGQQLTAEYKIKLGNLLDTPRGQLKQLTTGKQTLFDFDFSQVAAADRHEAALRHILDWLSSQQSIAPLQAVGHRIVHGGHQFDKPMRISPQLREQMAQLIPLAPLHQPFNLKLVDACHELAPEIPQIACFDTMFHTSIPELESLYAIPKTYRDAGIRRYGFHGLSYAYIQRQLQQIGTGQVNTVICHLGAGASMCAVKQGLSIASSMGFTAVEGLPMGSRSGSLDPGVLLYLQRHYHMDTDALENMLYKESGWLGISGLSSDMLSLHNAQNPDAETAIDYFCYRAALEIGRLSAALEGLEQLVFTGGVGENDADVRQRILTRCQWLGIKINREENSRGAALISHHDSDIPVRVIATNEEAMLAHYTMEVLSP
ncbi:acetate/propionate family kinase [Pontibacter sp. JAM-7]|uniref:acetate/propionate family kinase n=1 Tax=Pontibacter sp. JAM-7 TaxID=3366581 RepID=UPI003AF72280